MSSKYDTNMVLRKLTLVNLSDVTTTILIPDTVVFRHENKVTLQINTLDVSSFCYKKRAQSPSGQIGDLVDLASLDIHRLKIARIIIEHIRGQSYESAKLNKSQFSLFLNWVDANHGNFKLDDTNDMKLAYVGYTAYLLQRKNSAPANTDGLSATVATNYQKGACKLISLATGEDTRVIKQWATKLKKGKPGIIKAGMPSSEEQDICFAAHIKFSDEVHRVIVENGKFPLILPSPSGGTYYLYDDIGYRKPYYLQLMYTELRKHPELPPLDILIKDNPELVNLTEKEKKATYAILEGRLNEANSANRNSYRARNLVIMGMAAGLISFIAATGGNLSVVGGIEPDDFKLIPGSKGKRLLGLKGRANGKRVSPEFGARYSSTYNKILALREWLLGPKDSTLLFPFPRRGGKYGQVYAAHLQAYKALLAKVMPTVVWIRPTDYRKNVSYQYLKLSGGDTLLTAQKLGNTVGTIESHYGRPSIEDFAEEFTNFFDSMQRAAIMRGRSQNLIPVKILEDNSQSVVIPGGACTSSVAQPALATGFTSLSPSPACREPEYCVFCKHYAIHADETDLKRLLSIKFLIAVSQPHYDSDRWTNQLYPLQYRIDEIIAMVTDKLHDVELINKVLNDVESGELDQFWAAHLDTLVYMGYAS
ncbi:Uncharacterized protein ALO59_00480 [Pseudomonas amygdali pv. mellea]|uniref:hypothetical protein n=1 Tax=Pseudomonas amygdali TaxID=47877 RepID=UPI0006E5F75A|nr:hypothetical protein [Pseudomonas amygdali]KPW27376.1 hypothetical protein ALO51_200037 [Pseudomonas amygdali]KPX84665.1 Uncharacterized protein ALO59_00480 [Pseudomonas amygdali pv. mellea]